MSAVRCIAVFCGSRPGADPAHAELARDLGRRAAEAGLSIIYGGGKVGMMGIVADAALEAGGEVVGVIPGFLLEREVQHDGVDEQIETPDMHTRKALMYRRADAFVSLPGGIGTLDETVEVLAWMTLELHAKPLILVGRDYWAPLLELLEHMDRADFSWNVLADLVRLVDDAPSALALLR